MAKIDRKHLVFVSAQNYKDALQIAKDHGLQPSRWKFIPVSKRDRFAAISGHHGVPESNLIGSFTDEEKLYLTMTPKEEPEPKPPDPVRNNPKVVISISGDRGLMVEHEKKEEKDGGTT